MLSSLRNFGVLLLLVSFITTSADAQDIVPGMGTFTLVKSNDEVVGNGRYIIVNAGHGKAMKVYESGDYHKNVSVRLNEGKDVATVTDPNTAVLNLIKNGGTLRFWESKSISSSSGAYLAISKSSNNNNQLKTGTDNIYSIIDINIDELTFAANLRFRGESDTKYNTILYNDNAGAGLFNCYEETNRNQDEVRLYRETYTRRVTKGSFGTLCLPYSADLRNGDVRGATLYTIEGKQTVGGEVTSISLVKADTLLRGTPYIFLATDDVLEVRYKGYYKSDLVSEADGLTGSYEAVDVPKGKYVINGNRVRRCGSGCTIGTNRCYIDMEKVPEKSEASAGALIFSFDDTTDGLDALLPDGAGREAAIYDLNGRRVRNGSKGLLIVNGRKVVW